ncbi:MAG: hypothetical protein D3905_04445, partial [Candidatus Electrothrix sp. AS4_5]|nr:hypothetical protein [Candidatus Electrothrix gigas]
MTSRFDNTSEGDQNVGQGEGAIGKQTNIFLQPLRPRILVLVIVLLAGIGMGTYYLFAPPAKSLSTQGGNAPATVAGHDATVHYNIGLAPNLIAKSAEELGEKKQIIKGFLSMLLPEQVSQDQWDSKLREIAGHYKELRTLLETVEFEAPEVGAEIVRAVKAGNYVKVENLLNQAEARDVQAVEKLEQAAQQRRYSAALSCAVHALLQEEMQLGHVKAAEYWQKAAALVPEKDTEARS